MEYYIDGKLVRTVSGREQIDPNNYTNGTGLNKAMEIILDAENQTEWRPDPTITELNDNSKNIFWVDWVRVYKPVNNTGNGEIIPPTAGNTPFGKTIWLKANNGAAGYVGAIANISNAPLRANRNFIGQRERFQVENAGNGNVYLQSLNNNLYVQTKVSDGSKILANRINTGGPQTFKWESLGNGKVALNASNGKYVRAQLNLANNDLAAIGSTVKGWEVFNWGVVGTPAGAKLNSAAGTDNEDLLQESTTISVYPNPAHDATVTIEGVAAGKSVTILDMNGSVINEQNVEETGRIDISTLSNGIYFVKVNDKTMKLIIE